LKLGDFVPAENALRAAQNLEDDGWTNLYLGNLYLQTRDLERAEAECHLAHEKRPDLTAPLWCLGDVKEAKRDYEAAKKMDLLALELDSTCHESLARLGRQLLRKGQLDEGANLIREALRLEPSSAVASTMREKYQL
jgi:tetratricopeptide (TPR) repeat protein